MSKNTPTKTPGAIRGTQDIFGAEAEAFAFVVETFERVRRLYRFRRVEMPVFEKTEVFARSLGETTDVVSKEMYSFEDRGGDSLTLRPEFTAGIARAFLTNGAQGINLHRGTWHGVLTPLYAPGLFAVVDRIGPTPNIEEFRYPQPWVVSA